MVLHIKSKCQWPDLTNIHVDCFVLVLAQLLQWLSQLYICNVVKPVNLIQRQELELKRMHLETFQRKCINIMRKYFKQTVKVFFQLQSYNQQQLFLYGHQLIYIDPIYILYLVNCIPVLQVCCHVSIFQQSFHLAGQLALPRGSHGQEIP